MRSEKNNLNVKGVSRDNDLDITWYDYSNAFATWQNQVNWADALSVIFGGNVYTDWRLPTTVDGPYTYGYDGTTTTGYNITSSEMGHLFYTELGNKGYRDTSGNPQSGWGLTNTSDFLNLQPDWYWSGTEYTADPDYAWSFGFLNGAQYNFGKGFNLYAIAVHLGDVSAGGPAPIPEPGTLLLLGSGLAGLAAWRKRLGRIHG